MAIFALSDLHLPLGIDKPMNIFGARWHNYVEKIEYEWKQCVTENDYVIINGDFSWATYLEETKKDFEFLAALPGYKLLSKGNHDYWWTTKKKMEEFVEANGFCNISFMQNNAFLCGDVAVCAAKGWLSPTDKNFRSEDMHIYSRELIRFETSVKEAKKLSDTVVAALHFPPDDAFVRIMTDNGVAECVFGHLHGKHAEEYKPVYKHCYLVSADYLKFTPFRIF